ncbi:MAG: META domain-containing protein [Flavobacteriales bacterium]|nr:META domain-containing protein [Flavobacteriales bacterium]
MKRIAIAFTLFAILSANKCVKQTGSDPAALLDKTWVFESLNGEKVVMPDGVEAPWLSLAGDQLSGFGGCNRLMGAYKLGESGLSFTGIGSTKMYCEGTMPTENAVKQVLGQVDSYKIEGAALKLMGSGKELATMRAK